MNGVFFVPALTGPSLMTVVPSILYMYFDEGRSAPGS